MRDMTTTTALRRALSIAALACACLAGAHCKDQSSNDGADDQDAAPQLTQPTPEIKLSNEEIAGIMLAQNAAEIEEGTLASTQATDANVRTFASHLVTSHMTQDSRQRALFTKLAITPASSPSSVGIQVDHAQTMEALHATSGGAFDRAYVDAQVSSNTSYIRLLGDSMIPSTQNEDLLAELETTRITIGDQLTDAERLSALLPPRDGGIDAALLEAGFDAPITLDASDASDAHDASDASDASANDAGTHDAAEGGG
jgi:predicted outer membrane protein